MFIVKRTKQIVTTTGALSPYLILSISVTRQIIHRVPQGWTSVHIRQQQPFLTPSRNACSHEMGKSERVALVEFDGRVGEGGGQLVRVAVALAAITSTPIRIHHVRANR
jgi:hypothetical protein